MTTDLTRFVIAAYLVTFLGIGAYAMYLAFRVRATNRRLNKLPSEPAHGFGAALETVDLSAVGEAPHVR